MRHVHTFQVRQESQYAFTGGVRKQAGERVATCVSLSGRHELRHTPRHGQRYTAPDGAVCAHHGLAQRLHRGSVAQAKQGDAVDIEQLVVGAKTCVPAMESRFCNNLMNNLD